MAGFGFRSGAASRRLISGPAAAALALYAFCVLWVLIGLVHVPAYPAIGWLPLPVLAGMSAHACWRVTKRLDLAAPIRRFWREFSLACVLIGTGELSNMADTLVGSRRAGYLSPLTLALYMSVLLLALWALLRLPTWQRSRRDWTQFGFDAGIVLLTAGALAWHFSLRFGPQTAQAGVSAAMLGLIGAAATAVITFVKVAFAGAGQLDRRALHILSASGAVPAAIGTVTPLLASHPYLSSSMVACSATSLGLLFAAERQQRAPAMPAGARPAARRFSMLPYLAAVVMSALLILVEAPIGGEPLAIAVCVVALTGLVVVRQVHALRENGRLLGTVDANLQQLRAYQEQLAHQVSHDALTEIPNRALFAERVTAQLDSGEPFHVALLDLDDFKTVNDRLGHGTGDALLKAVSKRLREGVRPADTVARLGGDEFTLLLPGRTADETGALLRELVEQVQRPLLLGGQEMVARISVGVTAGQPGDTPEELLRRADVAMYAAKSVGGGRWTWFDPIMDQLADTDARLGNDLRHAIARDELFVLYQPIVELPHGRLAGVEALVRWRHPQQGLVSPAVFIPLAERNGSIAEVGWWVLEQVVRQAVAWEAAYGPFGPEKVSVNISARQLDEPGFPARVAELLRRTGLDPSRLVAEVTETAVLGTGEALDAVRELSELGIRMALDDFGTGQSSLSLLVDTPVKVLKVDKSFVDGVTACSPQAVIVDGLIGITDGLRIEAVAEGVETAEQADRLYAVGYRFAQGFHFARPMPPEDIELLLETGARASNLTP